MTTHADTSRAPHLELNDGNRIPRLGLGVFQVPADRTAETVAYALSVRYRHVEDMHSIAELDAGRRIGPDPATFVGA